MEFTYHILFWVCIKLFRVKFFFFKILFVFNFFYEAEEENCRKFNPCFGRYLIIIMHQWQPTINKNILLHTLLNYHYMQYYRYQSLVNSNIYLFSFTFKNKNNFFIAYIYLNLNNVYLYFSFVIYIYTIIVFLI